MKMQKMSEKREKIGKVFIFTRRLGSRPEVTILIMSVVIRHVCRAVNGSSSINDSLNKLPHKLKSIAASPNIPIAIIVFQSITKLHQTLNWTKRVWVLNSAAFMIRNHPELSSSFIFVVCDLILVPRKSNVFRLIEPSLSQPLIPSLSLFPSQKLMKSKSYIPTIESNFHSSKINRTWFSTLFLDMLNFESPKK